MDVGDEMQKFFCWTAQIGNLILLLLWHILHFIINIWYSAKGIGDMLESSIISSGIQKKYKALNLDKLHYLAIVVDNEEVHQTSKVIELLQWLAALGVKNVCFYDTEGVLKKSKDMILEMFHAAKLSEETVKNVPLLDNSISLDFLSSTDGKEAVAKAANHLFVKHYLNGNQTKPIFTESSIDEALQAVGAAGPEPDLLLVYGPARCHLGFPPWRIRYTEIVHIGSLKSMRYGSLIKALLKFTMVHQNYGR